MKNAKDIEKRQCGFKNVQYALFCFLSIVYCLLVPVLSFAQKTSDTDSVTLEEIGPGHATLTVHTAHARWLVYTESHIPTWAATINGVPSPIYTANYLYQAVMVPAGESSALFAYPPLFDQLAIAARNRLHLTLVPKNQ